MPLVTLTSVASKPETVSLNWKNTVKALEPTGAVAALVIVRAGPIDSAMIEKLAEPLWLPKASAAALDATCTVTVPPPCGVTCACQR